MIEFAPDDEQQLALEWDEEDEVPAQPDASLPQDEEE